MTEQSRLKIKETTTRKMYNLAKEQDSIKTKVDEEEKKIKTIESKITELENNILDINKSVPSTGVPEKTVRSYAEVVSSVTKASVSNEEVRKTVVRNTADNNTNTNDNITEIIKMAKGKIGLNPVSLDHIRKFSVDKSSNTTEAYNDSSNDVAREKAAQEFLVCELKFKENEVKIY